MKILFLNLYDDPSAGGGVETTLHHLTQSLLSRGSEPVMLATGPGKDLRQFQRDGVRIWRAGLRNLYWPDMKKSRAPAARMLWHTLDSYNRAMQASLRRVLEIEQPDVVSIHNLPGWSAAAWRTVADAKIPTVQVLHDSYAICPKATMYRGGANCAGQCVICRLLRLPHRRLSNLVSGVVGVSRFILDRHLGLGYFRHVPVRRVIRDARDGRELGLDNAVARDAGEPLRIGFIGRLDPTKGVEPLLKAFSTAGIANAELWIAGDGKASYEASLQAHYASEYIRFMGRVAPRAFYPQVDVVVVPSLWNDTFPGVLFEALAFGRPVIGSRRGGIPEMIRDGENGLLFEPSRPEELPAALQRVATDRALRARMAKAASASARPFLDREAWVSRYLDLYREIVGRSELTGFNGTDPGATSNQRNVTEEEA